MLLTASGAGAAAPRTARAEKMMVVTFMLMIVGSEWLLLIGILKCMFAWEECVEEEVVVVDGGKEV